MNKKPTTFQCPECLGRGGYTEPVLDYGEGPWETCGYCKGTGTVRRRLFYRILGWRSAEARRDRASKALAAATGNGGAK